MKQSFEFVGKTVFYYDGFDVIDAGCVQFKDVDFVADHMIKYNGGFCTVDVNGNVAIYSKLGGLLYETYVTEIFH